jgi:pectate lyase
MIKRRRPLARIVWMLPLAAGMAVALTGGPHVRSLQAASLPAFPGAEGYGAVTPGGRGGKIIKVTNLNASGPGSLQAACETEGPRIVVFEVGGVIRGDVVIRYPQITIAGQTAPSPGITIEGRLKNLAYQRDRLYDVVVRFLRVRAAPATGSGGDAVQLPNTERLILDHLSLAWANDETIDLCWSSDLTVQWCTIEESDPRGHAKGVPHNFGMISTYPGSGNVSIHHNLFAHQFRRSPSLAPYEANKPGDFRNNVVYDFRDGLTHDGHKPAAPINVVNNYYKRGPSAEQVFPFVIVAEGRYHIAGNYIEGVGAIGDPRDASVQFPAWVRSNPLGEKLSAPAKVAAVTTTQAQQAYTEVLARAGCFPPDRVTRRTIDEVRAGTGKWGRNAPDTLTDAWYAEGLKRGTAAKDGDGDGMPDDWEAAHGLHKADATDHTKVMASGYTAIEEYLAERARALSGEQR